MASSTPHETAIAVRRRCLALHITTKRIFFEAGVSRAKYDSWRHNGVNPRPEELARVHAVLERYEHAK